MGETAGDDCSGPLDLWDTSKVQIPQRYLQSDKLCPLVSGMAEVTVIVQVSVIDNWGTAWPMTPTPRHGRSLWSW